MEEEEMYDEINPEPVILCWVNGVPCYNEEDAMEAGKQTPAGKHIVFKLNSHAQRTF